MIDASISSILAEHGFTVDSMIGQGGFAQCFTVGWDQYPDITFVAKVITLNEQTSKRFSDSFIREVQTLKNIYHKNVIQIYKYFATEKYLFIIIEYCPNGTLYDFVLRHGTIGEVEFKDIARQCLEALLACHDMNIAHRDIKPTNIMFDTNHNIKLVDFGIADVLREQTSRHDGSLPFHSPEMFCDAPYIPEKADIWALGITFYFMVSGCLPWKCNTISELRDLVTKETPVYPSYIDAKIIKFINTMLFKEPFLRPSAKQLLQNPLFTELQSTRKRRVSSSTNLQVTPVSPVYRAILGHADPMMPKKKTIKNSLTCKILPPLEDVKVIARSRKYANLSSREEASD